MSVVLLSFSFPGADFLENRNVRPAQYAQHQVKRQATVAGGRPSVNSASFRQQSAPLQQAYRPTPSGAAGFRAAAPVGAPQGAAERVQQPQPIQPIEVWNNVARVNLGVGFYNSGWANCYYGWY